MSGQLYTLILLAVALSMDAFSVSLSIGMFDLRRRQIFLIGINIGLFHIMMPLLGILIGQLFLKAVGILAVYVGSCLLIIIGFQMIIAAFTKTKQTIVEPVGWGLLVFCLMVSVDSFATGLSLGIYKVNTVIALVSFGVITTIATWTGLIIGRKIKGMLGNYSLVFGGFIMLSFGLKLLLG